MKHLYRLVLGIGFCVALYLLIFQGFAAPSLPPLLDILLRFIVAAAVQYIAMGIGRNDLIRVTPLILGFLVAVWGFFLFLTSPSWQGATFGAFLADYVTPFLGCWISWLLYRKFYR